eukprot:scaffold7177_cov75-Phaeocystis_antarctica.AAC.2
MHRTVWDMHSEAWEAEPEDVRLELEELDSRRAEERTFVGALRLTLEVKQSCNNLDVAREREHDRPAIHVWHFLSQTLVFVV